jgi:hypothetical protein
MQQALDLNPRTPEAYDVLGRTFLDASLRTNGATSKQYAAMSVLFLSKARAAGPEIPHLSYHAAVAQKQLGDYMGALTILNQAQVESPGLIGVMECASACYRALGSPANIVELLAPLEAEGKLSPTLVKDLTWARKSLPSGPPTEVKAP